MRRQDQHPHPDINLAGPCFHGCGPATVSSRDWGLQGLNIFNKPPLLGSGLGVYLFVVGFFFLSRDGDKQSV